MKNLSSDRLLQRLQQFDAAGAEARAIGDDEFAEECEDVTCGLRELLALREAGKEPVGFRWRHESHNYDQAWSYVTHRTTPDAFESEQVVQYLYAAPQLPAVPDDTRRMDWLCSMVVDVREPLVYGSHSVFWSQRVSDDDEPHRTTLREQIDAAIAAAPKPGGDNG